MRKYLIIAVVLSVFSACETYSEEQKAAYNEEIEKFVKERNLKTEVTDTGLHYVKVKEGEGRFIKMTDKIIIKYQGFLTDSTKFIDAIDTFNVKGTILGWREGLTFFKKNGVGMFVIPPQLGYSANALVENEENGVLADIPENSILVYSFEILDVK
jgi:FKBP-type peptidyl-prolyl cis-trans isomerase